MRKVLIANRGEIAVRIARACRDAGLASVAVYAVQDRAARHVRTADEAVPLGGVTPEESYLDMARLLRAAADSGADALHPGYGYLAETYVGAATCEFLLGQDGTLAFLETNARLAVAHPVSEAVSGVDLVLETLRIAAGDALGYLDPAERGHALQFRIYAEDPSRGFAPDQGTVRSWYPPSGPGVRLDTGVGPGSVVTPAFGTLLAKLIVTGDSRADALRRARRALHEFEVAGVTTSLPFYRWLVTQEAFAPPPGQPCSVHTGWIEAQYLG